MDDQIERHRMPAQVARVAVLLIASLLLVACGGTIKVVGTADDAWSRTLAILREQGVLNDDLAASASHATRPWVDRERGEIDLPYANSVYYGEGAAFIQIDVSEPTESFERTVRMWVDYPVGIQVVRYGRALDNDATRAFHLAFLRAQEALDAKDTQLRAPASDERSTQFPSKDDGATAPSTP